MNTKPIFPIIGIAFLLGASLACDMSAITPTTQPPATDLPPSATETQETQPPAGIVMTFGGTTFTFPKGLAGGATAEATTTFELPYTNPGYGDMPMHLKFALANFGLSSKIAYIAVFPAEEYAKYSEQTTQTLEALKTMPDSVGDLTGSPLLQYGFYAQAKVVPFRNGRGLRYLTQVMQAPLPLNNAEMIYWFIGLTTDGKYYVSAALPVSASFLSASSDPAADVPAAGVPFPSAFDVDQITQYFSLVQQKLDGAAPAAFTPPLESMDELINSLDAGIQ